METVTSRDGTTIAFDRSGEGRAVILVGGAFQHRAFDPRTAELAALAEHFTVSNYDRRGRGDSGDTAPYAVERELEGLEAPIEEAARSAFVDGSSSGPLRPVRARQRGGEHAPRVPAAPVDVALPYFDQEVRVRDLHRAAVQGLFDWLTNRPGRERRRAMDFRASPDPY